MNIDFQYRSIEIDKEKKSDFDWYRFPIEIDIDFFLSIVIDYYRSTLTRCCPYGIIESFSRDIMHSF